ncbi:hypothetical protein P5V15_009980 [Pogonomyrmex californicus]
MITLLSTEIINIILQQQSISFKDVVNFSLTCKRFLNILNDNMLWQKKLYQRWPHLRRLYEKEIQNSKYINFKDQVKVSIECKYKLEHYLSLMAKKHFQKDELCDIDMEDFDGLFRPNMGAHSMSYHFFMAELIYLTMLSPYSNDCNLTHQYYGKKLLSYVHKCYLKETWKEFINSPKEQQILERAATIVTQWYQPLKHIYYLDVEAELDNITKQILEDLKKAHPTHPIFSTSAKQFSFWKCNNIDNNQWSRQVEQQIIDAVRAVLFVKLGFCGIDELTNEENKVYELEEIIIDGVLKNKIGNSITLAVIFHSVARRLGVRCDLIFVPTHHFLSWKPNTENSEDEEYLYIDILQGGAIRSKNDCPRTRGRRCPIENFNKHFEMNPSQMALRMINYLQMVNPNYQHHYDRSLQLRSLLEFRYMLNPFDRDTIQQLSLHYVQNHIRLSSIRIPLERILECCNDDSIEGRQIASILTRFGRMARLIEPELALTNVITPQERPCKMKYAVGMILTWNDRDDMNHTGVIIGWSKSYNTCMARESRFRILHNQRIPEAITLSQPFYTILCENGNKYYAAEDSVIEAALPKFIRHNKIGQYFCKYAWSHYVPNEVLATYYPQDMAVLSTLRLPSSFDYPHL